MADEPQNTPTIDELTLRTRRLEAVLRLVRAVTHDFNNMLAAVLGTADLLAIRLKDNDTARDDAEAIRRAAEHGAVLTKRLVALTRSQMLEPRIFDVRTVLADFLPRLRDLSGSGVAISMRATDEPASVKVEPGHLEQLLTNLVGNACEAMSGGGSIDIAVDRVMLEDKDDRPYPGLPAGPYVRLSISDSGPGIAPHVRPHIFEPFYTTKVPADGAGLGLPIVQGLARDGGGTVAYTTEPGRGTTFEVVLPFIEPYNDTGSDSGDAASA